MHTRTREGAPIPPQGEGQEKTMKMYVAPVDQGQMVEVSYGQWDGTVYRCCHDRSDHEVTWWASRALRDDEGEYWNGPPKNKRWRQVSGPPIDEE